jgi:hypothetical protein
MSKKPWETPELQKARVEYEEICAKRVTLEKELGLCNGFDTTDKTILDKRSRLKNQLTILRATQSEMKEELNRISDAAFSSQVRYAPGRVEALECLYRSFISYLTYERGNCGPVDKITLDQKWAAVIHTANEVSRFNKGQSQEA